MQNYHLTVTKYVQAVTNYCHIKATEHRERIKYSQTVSIYVCHPHIHKHGYLTVDAKLNYGQKQRIIKSTVCNVALYAAETWTLTTASKILLETSEMWTWWRMLKVLDGQDDKRSVGACKGN